MQLQNIPKSALNKMKLFDHCIIQCSKRLSQRIKLMQITNKNLLEHQKKVKAEKELAEENNRKPEILKPYRAPFVKPAFADLDWF